MFSFSGDASVRIEGEDRAGVERMLNDPEPVPEFVFDQSLPDEFDD